MKKTIICILIGLLLGLPLGAYLYSKFLDKPEVVNHNKIKFKRNKTVNMDDLN